MDPSEFVDAVREENKTALSRLGASKALYADTGGDLEDDAVLRAAADRAHHAAAVFETWADEESGAVADLFASAAASERDHVETVADHLDGYDPGDPPGVATHLEGVGDTDGRLGAFVGWVLAAGNNADQVVGYFVGQASPRTASTFREVSGDYDDYLDDAAAVVTETVDDPERAREAAGAAVQADYDDYFETLEAMGVNPKPVC
ncbi:rubrerythrin family protein [Halobacteriales archaeon QH_10_67_22]|nr:MAG: rubrerythrin family protein [Halobacteriales archaeon QH_10_67_22]